MLLVLDDDAQESLKRLLVLVQACGIRLGAIPEPEEAARVTMAIVETTADELLEIGKHWGRCTREYAWITEQLDASNPISPTCQ